MFKRTRPYTDGEKEAIQANKKSSQLLTCGTIPSYTQDELNAWTPDCPALVWNSTSQKANVWNVTAQIWEEVGGGTDFVMIGSPDLTTGGTGELLRETFLTKIDPAEANLAWTITLNWVAAVTGITGTATGVTVGDSIGGKLIFRYKKVGGTATINGLISNTQTGDASMSTASMGYQIGASDELEIIFTGPTFAGGGTLSFDVKAEIDLVEVTW